ncbi:MAG: hypothetical protein HKM24_06145 [Gammaproteobacteria bacterium]|nr:hypothetical protein [Gammaproteobacteria bacterium]
MAIQSQHKVDLLKDEFVFLQSQVDKFDKLSANIKTWVVTLWAASIGWAIQIDQAKLLLVSIAVIILFWFYDAMNKNYRQNYSDRLHAVGRYLQHYFKTGEVKESVVSPKFPTHHWLGIFRRGLSLHIALPYLVLVFLSLVLIVGI